MLYNLIGIGAVCFIFIYLGLNINKEARLKDEKETILVSALRVTLVLFGFIFLMFIPKAMTDEICGPVIVNQIKTLEGDSFFSSVLNGSGGILNGSAQGQMAFWNGSKWVHTETSELVWDDTNKRVGIGKATPRSELDVNGKVHIGNIYTWGGNLDIGGAGTQTLNIGTGASGGAHINLIKSSNVQDNVITLGRVDNNRWEIRDDGTDYLKFISDHGSDVMVMALEKNTGNVGIGKATPSYPLEVNGNVSGISIWSEGNISADGYITRTSIYDKEMGNALNYVQDSDYYITNDEIDHTKFYGYAGEYEVTDYSKPINKSYIEEVCEDVFVINETIQECYNITKYNIVYPYKKMESGVSLSKEVDVLRQAVYELSKRVEKLEK